MEYQVEDISPIKKKVIVSVPVEAVDTALEKALSAYSSDVQIKGFRKGKAPKSLLKSRFKKEIHTEATTELVQRYVTQIMAEIKLNPVSPYDFEGQEVEEGQPYQFSYQFEILPEVDLPDYEGAEVKQAEAVVTDEDIDKVVESIRKNMSTTEDISETRPPLDGESALISMEATLEGRAVPELTGHNFEVPVGAGHLLPIFEDLIKKTEPGQSSEQEVTLPEDYQEKKLAGKAVNVKITLHSTRQVRLPEVNDELAKKAGQFEDVAAMREAIRKSFLQSRANMNKAEAQKRLIDQLLTNTSFPLPEYMVEERLERNLKTFLENLGKRGGSWEQLEPDVQENLRKEMLRDAAEFVRESIFLQAVAKKENLEVSQADYNEFFTNTAGRAGQNPHELRRHFEDEDLMTGLTNRLLIGKALELLYDKAKVTEVPADQLASPEDATEEKTEE